MNEACNIQALATGRPKPSQTSARGMHSHIRPHSHTRNTQHMHTQIEHAPRAQLNGLPVKCFANSLVLRPSTSLDTCDVLALHLRHRPRPHEERERARLRARVCAKEPTARRRSRPIPRELGRRTCGRRRLRRRVAHVTF